MNVRRKGNRRHCGRRLFLSMRDATRIVLRTTQPVADGLGQQLDVANAWAKCIQWLLSMSSRFYCQGQHSVFHCRNKSIDAPPINLRRWQDEAILPEDYFLFSFQRNESNDKNAINISHFNLFNENRVPVRWSIDESECQNNGTPCGER